MGSTPAMRPSLCCELPGNASVILLSTLYSHLLTGSVLSLTVEKHTSEPHVSMGLIMLQYMLLLALGEMPWWLLPSLSRIASALWVLALMWGENSRLEDSVMPRVLECLMGPRGSEVRSEPLEASHLTRV